MSLRTKLSDDLKESLKAKNAAKTAIVRLILAALKDKDIAARDGVNNAGISEAEILRLLESMIKQRRESIVMYEKGGGIEQAKAEQAEIDLIQEYLPQKLDDAAVEAIIVQTITEVGATSIKDMGKVIAVLREKYSGQMDFGAASGIVKAKLG
jgi:uncharacterized protein YqeY